MELVEVEITGLVITSRYGTLNTGAILRTDADFARHLVEDAGAAKYSRPKPAPKVVAKPDAEGKPARKAKAGLSAAPGPGANAEIELPPLDGAAIDNPAPGDSQQ